MAAIKPHILAVDDDPHIRDVIAFALEKVAMRVTLAADGLAALEAFAAHEIDFIILDIGMPEMDGMDVCRQIRKTSEVPILFLSAHDDEIDRIVGLELGADDYVTKPFSTRELVARIKTILRRADRTAKIDDLATDVIHHGDLQLDVGGHRIAIADRPVDITSLEFSLMLTLARAPNRVFSRDVLLDTAWPDNIHVSDRTIDSHVRNIRAKFAKAGCDNAITTVHGVGFRLGTCKAQS